MRKPDSLRAFLVANVPGMVDDQEKLAIFVDKGGVICRPTRTINFEYRYTLSVCLMPFTGDVDDLIVPLLAWVADNQPDLLSRESGPFGFDAEILDQDATDVTITLALSERVKVTPKEDGGFEAVNLDEPTFPDQFADVTALLRQLYLNDGLALESTDPAWLASKP
jgi:hypothetical protein